jgi:hypothetical protein
VSDGSTPSPASPAETAPTSRGSREELLERMWWAMADAVLANLAAESPSASALQVGRAFLRDNGITLDTLSRLRHRWGGVDMSKLPTFNDHDDDGSGQGGASDPALRSVPKFAPPPNFNNEDTPSSA